MKIYTKEFKMSSSNLVYKIITYTAVFVTGYYLGGGCDERKVERYEERTKIERKLKENEMRLKDLEDKLKTQR